MKHTLPEPAREFVLYQRTELLPERKPNRLKSKLMRMGVLKDDYRTYVRDIAERDAERIDEKYFSTMQEKVDSIIDFIPASTSTVLDIGCGIAALDLFLAEKLDLSGIYLLDKTKTEEKIWYMFEEEGAFYNSLGAAKDTLTSNGIDPAKVHLIEAPDDGVIPIEAGSVDLVLSTISWGFHYPISVYIDSVMALLSEAGCVIVDVRKGTDGEAELRKHMSVEVIGEREKILTLKGTR